MAGKLATSVPKHYYISDITIILGVDKTFNFGDVFVTDCHLIQIMYQAVIRKDTMDHPIPFVPIFVNGTYTITVYGSSVQLKNRTYHRH